MRIAQLLLPSASRYERKSQRIDFAALAASHEVALVSLPEITRERFDVAHVYAGKELPSSAFVRFPIPYLSSAPLPQSRWSLRKPVAPAEVVTPLNVQEAVEEQYFEQLAKTSSGHVIGTYGAQRPGVQSMIERSLARIHRFRDDLVWNVFDHVPTREDLADVDVWVDPASEESDYDGCVAEAVVSGTACVATRTAVNVARLEKGRTGFVVPLNDPNELVHAILAALFKPEVAQQKIESARQTQSKFRPRQRLRILEKRYGTLTR
jgi:glycosyltransferase involved in cell wall biosynthesis